MFSFSLSKGGAGLAQPIAGAFLLPHRREDRQTMKFENVPHTRAQRLELYFDHDPEGTKSLVWAWGNKTVQVTVAEPAVDETLASGGSAGETERDPTGHD